MCSVVSLYDDMYRDIQTVINFISFKYCSIVVLFVYKNLFDHFIAEFVNTEL